ncbi:MAG: phosphoribosylamine--glycine ligase [Euryarchaeota archaeon]|nr:phosphoribosylamine--glycine ligase [Euryarchaeota archaeon]
MTKVLLVGGGAREHAMAMALARSPGEPKLVAALSNANPGILALCEDHMIVKETDVEAVVTYARDANVDLVLIGPEAPLEAGLSDALRDAGFPVAAPSKGSARIETDKAWMRELMARRALPGRVAYGTFSDPDEARQWINAHDARVAVKPVGLTGGKGVKVFRDHFQDTAGAMAYVDEVLSKGIGGSARVVVEERLEGEEFTLMAFTDGKRILEMPAVQDHKRLLPDDEGPNTGGMGAYSQSDGLLPFLTAGEYDAAVEILQAIVDALAAEGHPYQGPIYGQFMVTADGPKVIEVNARFGDPEAMNVLSLLVSDYLALCQGMAAGDLGTASADFEEAATVVKYVVPEGYGQGAPAVGVPIRIDDAAVRESRCTVFYAAVDAKEDHVVTTTSRALAVFAKGDTLSEANERCEAGLKAIQADRVHVRHDIGTKELIQRRIEHMRHLRSRTLETTKGLGP